MMKHPISWLFLMALTAILASCGPTVPTEAEVRARVLGVYCADSYRLELTDSTYFNRKVSPSPLGRGQAYESCRGRFVLSFEEDQWVIRFARDRRPQAIQNCEGEYILWNAQSGFVHGDEETITLPDLFDHQELTKDACE